MPLRLQQPTIGIRALLLLGLAFVIGAVAAFLLASTMRPAWRAETAVVFVEEGVQGGLLAGLGAQVGGLASLAGAMMPAPANRSEALAVLRSKDLIREYIRREQLLPELAAAVHSRPEDQAGFTLENAVGMMTRSVVSIGEDRRSGVITLSVTWIDREKAAAWANGLVRLANEVLRARALAEAGSREQYLRGELEKTDLVAVREAVYRLMENQIKAAMVARTRTDFAFRTVDRATVPDAKSKVRPRRSLIALFGGVLATLLGYALLWLRR